MFVRGVGEERGRKEEKGAPKNALKVSPRGVSCFSPLLFPLPFDVSRDLVSQLRRQVCPLQTEAQRWK